MVKLKTVWAVKDLNASHEIEEILKALGDKVDANNLPMLMKKCFLIGFDSALQHSASFLNTKEQYNFANEVLKIGDKEI